MTPLRRILLALLAAAMMSTTITAAPALAQGDTAAVAINTKDGGELFKFAFQVRRTMKDVVENNNAAVAYASCTECTTVAISFQVVLAGGSPTTVTPTNIALAINDQCSSCLTAAFAYQFVLAGAGPYRFTPEGSQRIAALRKELRRLEGEELTIDQLAAALDEAKTELRDILATEVIVGHPPEGGDARPDDRPADGGGEPPPGPSPTPSAEPDAVAPATPTPTPTATATPTPESTPTPTATATPTATP
jgi:putative peptide zinc metalloprotease protein